jgi:hypothetical protein
MLILFLRINVSPVKFVEIVLRSGREWIRENDGGGESNKDKV